MDRQNYLIYSKIVFYVAFLFFLVRGIYFIKINDYKSAIIHFIPVVVFIAVEIFNNLMYSGAF